MSEDQLGLLDTPPSRGQVRFGLAILGLLLVASACIVPVREAPLREFSAFVPMVDAVIFVGEMITATLLFAQAAVFRSRALTVLGAVFVATALLIVPHAMTFPGAFAPNGLLGAGLNTPSWLAVLRRGMFPLAAVLYVRMKRADTEAQPGSDRSAGIAVGVVAAIALAAAVTLLATVGHEWLPAYYRNRSDLIYANAVGYEAIVLALYLGATVVVFRTRSSVLDLWLLLAFSATLIQSLLIMTLQHRFTVGWYWLYALILFSNLVLMLALIAETNRLYAQLAVATWARDRERDARRMSLDAMSAAISHEVGQPLTAVSLHARAALNRLSGPTPDVKLATKGLRDILDAARRTTDVVKSIRAVLADEPEPRSEFSLNELVRTTTALMAAELAAHKISLELDLDPSLPPILADRDQIQRVLVNLLTNAIESLGATRGRSRRIVIRSSLVASEEVRLDVGDNGVGIAPDQMTRVFDAFFTTKARGAGLGLSLCSSTVEALGGHLWATQGEDHGATFHMQLPRAPSAA